LNRVFDGVFDKVVAFPTGPGINQL